MSPAFALDIAESRSHFRPDADDLPIAAEGSARSSSPTPNGPEVRIRASWGDPREPAARDPVFDSGKGLWRLYRGGLGLQFVFTSTAARNAPVPDGVVHGGLHAKARSRCGGRSSPIGCPLYPLQYPLDELVMVHLLARGRGVAIHGSGVVDADGRGYAVRRAVRRRQDDAWPGSGCSEPGVKILSDERVVLRREGDVVWMYGTPWHGDGRISNQGRAPLDRICFLRHAPRNQMTALGPTESIARLFSCCFPPFYDAAGLDDVLGSLERIVARCRSVELGFVPDAAAPAFVRSN